MPPPTTTHLAAPQSLASSWLFTLFTASTVRQEAMEDVSLVLRPFLNFFLSTFSPYTVSNCSLTTSSSSPFSLVLSLRCSTRNSEKAAFLCSSSW